MLFPDPDIRILLNLISFRVTEKNIFTRIRAKN
jgi:hypothetical protein